MRPVVDSMPHVAMRTCVGCGSRAPQPELLRLQLSAAEKLERVHRALPGRSGYLHARRDCLEQMTKRRLLARSLRSAVPRDRLEALREQLLADPAIGFSEA